MWPRALNSIYGLISDDDEKSRDLTWGISRDRIEDISLLTPGLIFGGASAVSSSVDDSVAGV
jgi:hypothetical protein